MIDVRYDDGSSKYARHKILYVPAHCKTVTDVWEHITAAKQAFVRQGLDAVWITIKPEGYVIKALLCAMDKEQFEVARSMVVIDSVTTSPERTRQFDVVGKMLASLGLGSA